MDPGITEPPAVGGGTTAHVVDEAQRPRGLVQGQKPLYGCEWWDLMQGQWAVYVSGGA